MTPELVEGVAWKSAAAGALALAFGGAPLGVLLIVLIITLIMKKLKQQRAGR